jgi:hypothetical protein
MATRVGAERVYKRAGRDFPPFPRPSRGVFNLYSGALLLSTYRCRCREEGEEQIESMGTEEERGGGRSDEIL